MKAVEVRCLVNGLYRLHWKSGGSSLAAVGVTNNGGRWIAPVNWVAPTMKQEKWRIVERAELLAKAEPCTVN